MAVWQRVDRWLATTSESENRIMPNREVLEGIRVEGFGRVPGLGLGLHRDSIKRRDLNGGKDCENAKAFCCPNDCTCRADVFTCYACSNRARPSRRQRLRRAENKNENIHLDGWDRPQVSLEAAGKKPGPAPVYDLSGIWEPVPRYRDGVFGSGPKDMPEDGKHELIPFTPLGKETYKSHKPG